MERLSVQVGTETITFETGRIAKQAQGSVLVTCGETIVLSAVTVANSMRPGQDFFPMTVDYREKAYAAGAIPGNFFRREARPSEREILVCRLTDRPLRPLFPKGFLNETQVCQTVLSADNIQDPDVLAINAASAAVHISKIPFNGPIGAVRMGRIDGELVVNPAIDDMEDSTIDIVMAGTKDSIVMVEGGASQEPEDVMLDALDMGHQEIKKIIACIEELREKAGVEKMAFEPPVIDEGIKSAVEAIATRGMNTALTIAGKEARQDALDAVKDEVHAKMEEKLGADDYAAQREDIKLCYYALEKHMMRVQTVSTQKRVDGRALDEIRKITIEMGVLPRAHGSTLFTRGETQAIVATTLGTARDEQRIDQLTGDVFKRFFLHYNFPPWSVGETRRIMGPGRREVGHGRLAERALETVVPFESNGAEEDFPYTVRIVSEITESNGSSSMASVCGGSLSMMDAGVKTLAPVAGIAMGLIKEGDDACVLSDILGVEDHLGDMDFKVCGTANGITAFQMDCKIAGVSRDLMAKALDQAKAGREHILGKMAEAISGPREDLSKYAPRITTIQIPVDKIRDIIGPGGKVIREIQASTGADVNVEDDGKIAVAAADSEAAKAAIEMIESITAEAEVGAVYHGTVTRLMNFGAFVNIVGTREGLVHISEMALGRVDKVEDVMDVGDEVDVKVIEIDNMGRVNLSKLQADVELGRISAEDYEEKKARASKRPERGRGGRDGGGRGGRDGGGRDRR
ncbi:MAG: polyribonucleotide nucleotidyltransferase [Candidatus Hydrogenedentes bacterium]|nr:polyribonucleotide nucleotidyltransferase [Candidatus Hydrogenedentota bacterium]